METEKSRILWCRTRTVELSDSHINSRFQQTHYRFNTSMSSPVTKKTTTLIYELAPCANINKSKISLFDKKKKKSRNSSHSCRL